MKETNPTPRRGLRQYFLSDSENRVDEFKELIPIFILITVVMIGLYIQSIFVLPKPYTPVRVLLLTGLFFIHLLLYWMILNFVQTGRRALLYLLAQGVLASLIVLLSGNVYLVIGLFASLSGTLVGTLGRTRLTVLGLGLYLILAGVDVAVLSRNIELSGDYFFAFVAAVGFASFFAYLFYHQVAAREQAQTLLQELETAHTQLAEYANQVEQLTLTAERQRMARELHDTLAQGLAGLILQLEAADSHLAQNNITKAQTIIQQAMTRARTTLADARRAIGDLRETQTTPTDLNEAIRTEAERFRHATGIPCTLGLCQAPAISPQLAENILRAVSEGLMNAARHAQAREVLLTLSCDDQNIWIEIRDDGIGFDPQESLKRSGHYGLIGIRERARLYGGSLTIESRPSQGTTLKIQLPLADRGPQTADL